MSVAVIILQYGKSELTHQCVQSLIRFELSELITSIYVIDNYSPVASDRESIDALALVDPRVRILKNSKNLGFGVAHNLIAESINEDYMLLLNNDAYCIDGTLNDLVVSAIRDDADVATGTLLNEDLSYQESTKGFYFFPSPFLRLYFKIKNLIGSSCYVNEVYCNGALLLIKKEVFKAVGGFDPALFMYSEDLDLMFKLNKFGYIVKRYKGVAVVHLGGVSSAQVWGDQEKVKMQISQGNYVVRNHCGNLYLALISILYLMSKVPALALYLFGFKFTSAKQLVHRLYWKIKL